MGDVIETIGGVAVFILIVSSVVGWLVSVFTGSGGSGGDFDSKDPGDGF